MMVMGKGDVDSSDSSGTRKQFKLGERMARFAHRNVSALLIVLFRVYSIVECQVDTGLAALPTSSVVEHLVAGSQRQARVRGLAVDKAYPLHSWRHVLKLRGGDGSGSNNEESSVEGKAGAKLQIEVDKTRARLEAR